MIKNTFSIILLLSIVILMNTGCSLLDKQPSGWKPTTPQRDHFEHVVKWPGETLRIIAKWYTGDAENWPALADANPQIDYNKIRKGNIIYIPENLLKNKKALPKTFISSYNQKLKPKPKKTTKKPEPAPKPKPKKKEKNKKDDFELFGPK